jgi:uncharacterized membrane protein
MLEHMKVMYCGDDEFASPYLLGALGDLEYEARYVSPATALPRLGDADTVVLSDYPAAMIDTSAAHNLMRFVRGGGRLVMLGGWTSFNGMGRNYFGHPVATMLPVGLEAADDRQNVPQGLLIGPGEDLDYDFDADWSRPPIICGYNLVQSKAAADEYVIMRPLIADESSVELGSPLPLVVAQGFGEGRVVCCMTDLAPHWCGGLLDWGDSRVSLTTGKEVGSDYLKFVDLVLSV